MAKWGEGDPRWIVEQRADATNVNNWHWTEKNASAWSKDKLRQLLEGLKIADEKYCCEIKEITKLEGEAVANNRKAKLIFFYEWEIKAEWKGILTGSENSHKGKIEILNVSEEYEPEDVDTNVTANTDKDEAYQLKEFLRKSGNAAIQEKIRIYITDLKKEFSQGMILPSENQQKENIPSEKKNVVKEEINKPVSSKSPGAKLGVKIPCKKITDKQIFKCRADEIYRALTEKEMVQAFTRNDVTIESEKGGRFVLFGGMVIGEFIKLEPYKKLEMRWRFKSWPVEHFSQVCLEFDEKDDCTEMRLTQTGVPESELDRTKEGWARYYWESIKQTFGFGASLF